MKNDSKVAPRVTNPRVFVPSAGVELALVIAGAVWTEPVGIAIAAVQQFLSLQFGWFRTGVVGFLLFFVFAVLLHPSYRRLRLGPPD